jgi:hypothetical protein
MRADWQKSPDDMEIRETDFITEDSSIDMLTVVRIYSNAVMVARQNDG